MLFITLMATVGVVLPTINEAENIPWLFSRLALVIEKIPVVLTVIVVDDGSTDNTIEAVKREAKGLEGARTIILSRKKKMGLHRAYKDAVLSLVRFSQPKWTVIMDADGSHDPYEIYNMLRMVQENGNLCGVIASRYICGGAVEDWGLFRRVLSLGANATASTLLGLKYSDVSGSFRLYDTKTLALVLENVKGHGFSVQEEILLRYRDALKEGSMGEHPYVFMKRRAGVSKCSTKEVLNFVKNILNLWLV